MKLKVDQIRTYDEAGFRQRAACLCFKSECESEVLLVSSSRCQDLWVVPGGGLEPGEKPETTAVREVNEEAGVIGRLERLLDVFENTERNTRTYVYVLIVERLVDEYDDAGKIGRRRKWFPLDEAINKLSVHKPVQQEYLDRLSHDETHLSRRSTCRITANAEHGFPDASNMGRKCSKCCQAFRNVQETRNSQDHCADKEITLNGGTHSPRSSQRTANSGTNGCNVRLLIEQTNSDPST